MRWQWGILAGNFCLQEGKDFVRRAEAVRYSRCSLPHEIPCPVVLLVIPGAYSAGGRVFSQSAAAEEGNDRLLPLAESFHGKKGHVPLYPTQGLALAFAHGLGLWLRGSGSNKTRIN